MGWRCRSRWVASQSLLVGLLRAPVLLAVQDLGVRTPSESRRQPEAAQTGRQAVEHSQPGMVTWRTAAICRGMTAAVLLSREPAASSCASWYLIGSVPSLGAPSPGLLCVALLCICPGLLCIGLGSCGSTSAAGLGSAIDGPGSRRCRRTILA